MVSCERYFDFTSFILEYKDSQQYVVQKMENRRQAAFFKFGYFNSRTSFRNSIIEEALWGICNARSSFITNNSNFPAAFSLTIIYYFRIWKSIFTNVTNGFTKNANSDFNPFKSSNLYLKFACNSYNFSLYSSNFEYMFRQ